LNWGIGTPSTSLPAKQKVPLQPATSRNQCATPELSQARRGGVCPGSSQSAGDEAVPTQQQTQQLSLAVPAHALHDTFEGKGSGDSGPESLAPCSHKVFKHNEDETQTRNHGSAAPARSVRGVNEESVRKAVLREVLGVMLGPSAGHKVDSYQADIQVSGEWGNGCRMIAASCLVQVIAE